VGIAIVYPGFWLKPVTKIFAKSNPSQYNNIYTLVKTRHRGSNPWYPSYTGIKVK